MVTPKGEKFLESVDTSGDTKDADFIAQVVGKAIKDVGQKLWSGCAWTVQQFARV
jgi:hypothetical protein